MQIPAAKIYFPEEDRKKILKQVDEILESGQLTLGKYTKEFDKRAGAMVSPPFPSGMANGLISFMSSGVVFGLLPSVCTQRQ